MTKNLFIYLNLVLLFVYSKSEAKKADLVILSMTVSPYGTPGNTIAGNAYIINYGDTSASVSMTCFLSLDKNIGASDLKSDPVTYANISGGMTKNLYNAYNTTLPKNLSLGKYYIILKIDNENIVSETNENNNTLLDSIEITLPKPDLKFVTNPNGPKNVAINNIYDLDFNIWNNGPSACSSGQISFFLSTDTVYDQTDILLGKTLFTEIKSLNYSEYSSGKITIPGNTSTGKYFLLFVIDDLNTISELKETNNTRFAPIIVANAFYDVLLYSNSPTNIPKGVPINLNYSVYNIGNISFPAIKTAYYLSTDSIYDGNDIMLGSNQFSIMDYGSYEYAYQSITIDTTTVSGQYYIIIKADYDEMVAETIETNNISITKVMVAAPYSDLILTKITSIPQGESGDEFLIKGVFRDIGNIESTGYHKVKIYCSKDTIVDSLDNLLYTSYTYSKYDTSFYANITLPQVASGQYYLVYELIMTDKDSVSEKKENNIISKPIIIGSPLGISLNKNETIVTVYPNPTTDFLYFQENENLFKNLEIYNLKGQSIHKEKIKENSIIDMSKYANGEYILKFYDELGRNGSSLNIIKQ